MDLTSYAELAVRLVNTGDAGDGRQDEPATIEAYRALMADRAYSACPADTGLTSTRSGNCAPSSG